ncbi:MAG: ATP-binding protein [Bacteroidetes bacterium]|nr:ATP-binding protein [Bacteroidota bacterium]
MNKLLNYWNFLIAIGIDDSTQQKENKYVRFTNVITLLTVIAILLYIPYSIIQGYYLLSALQFLDACCVIAVMWLNHKQFHKIARHAYLFVINAFVLINSCFIGHASGVHEFFYISYVVPFLLFSVRDYKNIIAGVLLAIVSFNIYLHIYPFFVQFNLDTVTQHTIFNLNMWMKFVLFGMAIYILAYYNFYTETELEDLNEKLKEQAVELKRSNEDLEQFTYVISHDLKAPVRNISSFMNLLLTRTANVSEDAKVFMQHSKESADRLARQIDDMLSYCKVDRNLPPTSNVDLVDLVTTIKAELNAKISERNANITVEGELPVMKNVHASLVYHVFQNLITNALKFNTAENPVIKIACFQKDNETVYSVSDNGIGIDTKFSEKIFQMFKRLHSSEQYEGSGIGLALCKKIINFYNGNIWLESTPGNGTTFFFTFSKAAEQKPEPRTPSVVKRMVPILKAA